MNFINLFKTLPLLLTLIIITIFGINNQNQSTKLKVLIWELPNLSLGTYLVFSTSTGFMLSYIFTTCLIKGNKIKSNRRIEYKYETINNQNKVNQDISTQFNYDNTLIERNINDPSPTVTASFRVIGNTNKINQIPQYDQPNESDNSDLFDDSDSQDFEHDLNYETGNEINPISDDWKDDSYERW